MLVNAAAAGARGTAAPPLPLPLRCRRPPLARPQVLCPGSRELLQAAQTRAATAAAVRFRSGRSAPLCRGSTAGGSRPSVAAAAAADAADESDGQQPPRFQAQAQQPQQQGAEAEGAVLAELFALALPTLATLAADPLASLVSTAFVGRLGAAPLAAAGVALSVYNSCTKLLNVPLLAITTSSVAQAVGAEQQAASQGQQGGGSGAVTAAVSAALLLAAVTGVAQAALLWGLGAQGLTWWGAAPGGALFSDAAAYLSMRALAAPATVCMLVLQGCFRGLGDTRTPFVGTLLANALNVGLEFLLLFVLGWGVRGAALAVGLSQAVACVVLLVLLQRRCRLQLVGGQALSRSLGYLGNTGLLALRTLAIMGVYALATSLAARTDPTHAAAHQIAYQLWLASSLLADSLAVAAQTLLARSLAAGQQAVGKTVVRRTLQMALALGGLLAAGLVLGQGPVAAAFTSDPAVLRALGLIMPAVILTQPINALAFLADGVLYGVGGFSYAAAAMVAACVPAGAAMLAGARIAAGMADAAAQDAQLLGVWAGLAALMAGRFLTIYVPLLARRPPFDKLDA